MKKYDITITPDAYTIVLNKAEFTLREIQQFFNTLESRRKNPKTVEQYEDVRSRRKEPEFFDHLSDK